MNYYEEFGVQLNATAGQIRLAYKTLVRLLHPDSQTDEALKAVAELQMRRLNGMLETLLDAEKRRAYDESLGENRTVRLPPPELYHAGREGGWPGMAQTVLRHWFWILTGLVVAGTAVWYAAIKDSALAEVARAPGPGPSVPGRSVPSSPAPVAHPAAAPVAMEAQPAPANVPHSAAPLATDGSGPGAVATELPPAKSDRESLDASNPSAPAMGLPPAGLPAAPVNTAGEAESPQVNLRRPGDSERQCSWAGNWLYAPQLEDAAQTGLYAPSYIEFMLVEDHGNLVGNYRARYRVPDKALSSEVGFRAQGRAPSGNLAQLAWASDEGAKGGVELELRSSDLLKVTWWTTAFGRHAGLTSGTATLVRQRTR